MADIARRWRLEKPPLLVVAVVVLVGRGGGGGAGYWVGKRMQPQGSTIAPSVQGSV